MNYDVPAAGEQQNAAAPADDPVAEEVNSEIPVPPPPVRLTWTELPKSTEVALETAQTTLTVVNESGVDAVVELAGTIPDWMRALWDTHTDSSCPLTKQNLTQLYGAAIQHPLFDNESAFSSDSWVFATLYSPTCMNRWLANGCHNGVDRAGQVWSGC